MHPICRLIFSSVAGAHLIASGAVGQEPAHTKPSVVFVVRTTGTTAWLDPIALVTPDSLQKPPVGRQEPEPVAFRRHYYSENQVYRLLSGNEPAGTVTAFGPSLDLCYGLGGRGVASFLDHAEDSWVGLATDDPGLGGRPLGRAASSDEAAALVEFARRDVVARGYPDSLVGSIRLYGKPHIVDWREGSEAIVGGAAAYIALDSGLDRTIALLVFMPLPRLGGDTFWFGDNSGDRIVQREVLDVLDFDGDEIPELVVRAEHLEWWYYEVYRDEAGTWTKVYRGGGGGC